MKLPLLLANSSPKILSQYSLALAAGLLLYVGPTVAHAQSVTFAGALTTLKTDSLYLPLGMVVDSEGDLIIEDTQNDRIVELPWTGTGFGPQFTIPAGILTYPYLIAIDGDGDLFINGSEDNRVLELPKTATGYGPQTVVYDGGPFVSTTIFELATDSNGNLFIGEGSEAFPSLMPPSLVEVPRTATGYGPPTNLPVELNERPGGLAVDSAGNIFISDTRVLELPKTATGYGPQTVLSTVNIGNFVLDGAGNVFGLTPAQYVVELPRTSAGLGHHITLPLVGGEGLAVDKAGNLFAGNQVQDSLGYVSWKAVELQRGSVNFGSENICPAGATHPYPCNQDAILYYGISADQTLGTPNVLTGGAPDLDFQLKQPSNCTGADKDGTFCQVKVLFAPHNPGVRSGTVQVVDTSGNVLTTTSLDGVGVAIGNTAQSIDFDRISAQTAGSDVPLTATATSGLPVAFTSSTQKICTINGPTAILLASGKCEVKAVQAGSAEYYPASRRQSFFVHHVRQTIDFSTIAPQVAGTVLYPEATASSSLPIVFTSTTENVCIVYNDAKFTTKLIAEGTCTLRALAPSNAEYYKTSADESFHVSSAP